MNATPEAWPTSGPEDNRWNLDASGFLALIQANPNMWLGDHRLKYLKLHVDTRDGGFVLEGSNGEALSTDDVLSAIKKMGAKSSNPPADDEQNQRDYDLLLDLAQKMANALEEAKGQVHGTSHLDNLMAEARDLGIHPQHPAA